MINIEQLKQDLETLIAAIDDESTAEDLLTLVASIDTLTEDRIVNVTAVDDLPDLFGSEFPSGSVFFVEEIGVLVVSVGVRWLGLDGRVLRDETPIDAMSWGSNQLFGPLGQLGDNTTENKSSPVTVIGGITNWSQVSAGDTHSLGITDDGIAYAWGSNGSGRLGDGTTIDRSSPVTVVGGITNWSQVTGKGTHSLGLTDDGIAYAWGNNNSGKLGDGTGSGRNSPVTVVGNITNWSQLSAGTSHSLGVTDDGIAYAWGITFNGQLGNNQTIPTTSSPVTVVGNITNWIQLDCGRFHSLGITDDGIAYAWGSNGSGRLGDGTTIGRSSPVTVVGGITNWSQLSAGASHSVGITDDGILYSWGSNSLGIGGTGIIGSSSSPNTVVTGITNWKQVSTNNQHTLAITDDGIAYAWGNNNEGRLGTGTETRESSPVIIIGSISGWSQISAGVNHSLGIKLGE